jgi:glycosyltransferase involved in cell wall biosynthesis
VKVDALTPFGRGAGATLAGRTILQILPRLEAGGDDRATLAVAAALVRAGARALVASERGPLTSELQAIGGLHIAFPAASRNPIAMALNVRKLARILVDERVDVVHARSRAPAWVALGACKKAARPLVTSFFGAADGRSALKNRYDSVMAQGDLVIANSEFAAERIARRYTAARGHLRIVRPGVDLQRYNPAAVNRARVAKLREAWGAAAHERIVLAPGPISAARGQSVLIESAAALKARGHDDIRYVLIGEGQSGGGLREVESRVASAGLGAVVTFARAADDLPAAFLAASVVAIPAIEPEGLARFAIEAQAMGALTIVSNVGSAGEIVLAPPQSTRESRTGWRTPAKDAGALAGAIEEALGMGASAREALRQRARTRAAGEFSVERMARDTLAVYSEAIEK